MAMTPDILTAFLSSGKALCTAGEVFARRLRFVLLVVRLRIAELHRVVRLARLAHAFLVQSLAADDLLTAAHKATWLITHESLFHFRLDEVIEGTGVRLRSLGLEVT